MAVCAPQLRSSVRERWVVSVDDVGSPKASERLREINAKGLTGFTCLTVTIDFATRYKIPIFVISAGTQAHGSIKLWLIR
jgi:hypothetical protein